MKTLAWPLEPSEVDEAFRALQFGHFKWDIYHRGKPHVLSDALVLSQVEHEEIVGAAESVWRGLRELEAAVLADTEALAAVGISEELRPLVRAPGPESPRITRCDIHPTTSGAYLISEFNEDCPTGFAECSGVHSVLSEGFGDRFAGYHFAGDLRRAVLDALRPFERVGVACAMGYSDDLQHAALVADWIRGAGREAVMGAPRNLVLEDDRPTIFGEPVDAIFRYAPGEALGELADADVWARARAAVPIVNDPAAVVAQSKRFYAALGEHGLSISEAARQRIEAHIPRSLYLTPERRDQILGEREEWVLKGAFGRMGDAVCIGAGVSDDDWRRAIDEALEGPEPHAVQAYFETRPHWFSRGLGFPTIGVFLVEGSFAGYFTRVSRNPVIDYDSAYVPTVVEIS